MLNFYIFGSFFAATQRGTDQFQNTCFIGGLNNILFHSIIATKMRIQIPPKTLLQIMHKHSPHSFTHTHARTVRPMSGTAARPSHFMVNSAGCVYIRACDYFYVLFCVCVCVCACWVYLPSLHHNVSASICTSHCPQYAYVHTAASVRQLGSVWSKGSFKALIYFHGNTREIVGGLVERPRL